VLDEGKIDNYQIAIPSRVNASPRTPWGELGPCERTVLNTPIIESKFTSEADGGLVITLFEYQSAADLDYRYGFFLIWSIILRYESVRFLFATLANLNNLSCVTINVLLAGRPCKERGFVLAAVLLSITVGGLWALVSSIPKSTNTGSGPLNHGCCHQCPMPSAWH
jgi:hypothetical protein